MHSPWLIRSPACTNEKYPSQGVTQIRKALAGCFVSKLIVINSGPVILGDEEEEHRGGDEEEGPLSCDGIQARNKHEKHKKQDNKI